MDKKKCGYVFVTEEGFYTSVWEVLFNDLLKQENVMHVTEPKDPRPLAHWLKKNKLQTLTRGKLNFYLAKHYALQASIEKLVKEYETAWVVFLNVSFIRSRYPARLLLDNKKKWNSLHYALFYVDCVERPFNHHVNGLLKRGDIFDRVYTFDAKDAKEYGLRHWDTVYSKLDLQEEIIRDLFFCGLPSSRRKEIEEVLKACSAHHVKLQMNLVCGEEDYVRFAQYAPAVSLGRGGVDFWPYPQTVAETLKARCILDITQHGQAGLTLRPYEAVCYNRKLLTNNKSILNFKFYNPKFMQYFEKIEDIDWDWVKDAAEVDYHYSGEFSPLHLLEDIVKFCEEM